MSYMNLIFSSNWFCTCGLPYDLISGPNYGLLPFLKSLDMSWEKCFHNVLFKIKLSLTATSKWKQTVHFYARLAFYPFLKCNVYILFENDANQIGECLMTKVLVYIRKDCVFSLQSTHTNCQLK